MIAFVVRVSADKANQMKVFQECWKKNGNASRTDTKDV
jgi:hypothetical protein